MPRQAHAGRDTIAATPLSGAPGNPPQPHVDASTREILRLAEASAARLGHRFVGTEHLLLGTLEHGDNLGVALLRTANVDVPALQSRLSGRMPAANAESRAGEQAGTMTSRAAFVAKLAIAAATATDSAVVTPGHLMVALVDEGQGLAAQELAAGGLKGRQAHAALLDLLG